MAAHVTRVALVTLSPNSRIWLALLLLGLFSLGEMAVIWHESQLEVHASGAACDACVVAKPLKHAATAANPVSLPFLAFIDTAPAVFVHAPRYVAPQRPYQSRAPPSLV